MYIVVGLGNPGEEYLRTRHNTGRMAAHCVAENPIPNVKVITPDTFMNVTGAFVKKYVKNEADAEKLIVIYDDLDLPMGSMRISYDRGSGGHNGVESIINALGTERFIRIRIGVSPVSPEGEIKKIKGEEKVEKHILGEFKPAEMEVLNKVFMNTVTAVATIVEKDLQTAMTQFNS
jgi:peptidyl-tRNA hydrolase, PTH1 family